MSQLTLGQYQALFCQELLSQSRLALDYDQNTDSLLPLIDSSPQQALDRIAIYRNNVLHSISAALGDLYPVVKRLIGDDCFNGAAVEFVRQLPPSDPVLLHYGEAFIEFIAQFPACQNIGFIKDIAMLEYHYNRAFHSEDTPSFELSELRIIAPENLGELSFTCHQSLTLFQSAWPVQDIWHENLKDEPELIDLDQSTGSNILIYRQVMTVQVINLDTHCYQFLKQLSAGATINTAWQITSQHAVGQGETLDEEELSPMLGYLLNLQLFTHFQLTEN
ncbi:MAG: putative DNA-binding domain-containing protein [Psychrobium sp.]|nr:putative DNA-binding domain-containing protein [Psychrobium sp.]